ncbi:MAG: hypothetical protein EXQ74_04735 [Thermoleophilia bacterium]|nr:hypothetical protein [Thermoleophilia bacterium]
MRTSATPHQADPDQVTLTSQAYLRRIGWKAVARPLNRPLVAVLDTGVAPSAAGLTNRIDTQSAKSFVMGGDPLTDPEGHGTVVSGIIVTVASGTSTVPGVRILPVQIVSPTGETSPRAVAAGIHYAVSRGARIINLSLGGTGFSTIEQDAINDAVRAGVLVVAASGNAGTDRREYPGAYRHVLAVGATDDDGVSLVTSTRGMQVAVAAPGRDISAGSARGPEGGPRFEVRTGTSMAAAVVTGAAARILQTRPTLTATQVTELLMATARGTGDGLDRARGTGVIDLTRALKVTPPPVDLPEPDDDPPNARRLPPLVPKGFSYGQRTGLLRTWADLRDGSVVHLETGQRLTAEATVGRKADVDLYLWKPDAPVYRQGAAFARRWLAVGAVTKGSVEMLTYRASIAGDYVLEVRLAGAVRLVRPRYTVTGTVTR